MPPRPTARAADAAAARRADILGQLDFVVTHLSALPRPDCLAQFLADCRSMRAHIAEAAIRAQDMDVLVGRLAARLALIGDAMRRAPRSGARPVGGGKRCAARPN